MIRARCTLSSPPADRDHRANQLEHAETRLWQRYGLARTAEEIEWDVICPIRLRLRSAVRVRALDHGRELWRVSAFGRELPVVYDPATDAVATFLPPWVLANNRKRKRHERAED